MKRKTIALCVCGSMRFIQDSIIEGVRSTCETMDINLLIFHPMVNYDEMATMIVETAVLGENMIYDLIPYEQLDGLILDSSHMYHEAMLRKIIDNARAHDVPVISLNSVQRGCLHINVNDTAGAAAVVRHLVEEHGLRRINFMGGFPDNEDTQRRLTGYRQVLAANDIPFEEGRVSYGGFGPKAEEALQEILSSPLPFPEAIVCANDLMAVSVISCLIERGYRVPEDVMVVGFDGSDLAQSFYPSITTVRRGMRDIGEIAVTQLYRLWNGRNVPLDSEVVPDIIFGQSCGCRAKSEVQVIKMFRKTQELFNTKNNLAATLAGAAHYAFMGKTIQIFLERMREMSEAQLNCSMMFCMADEPIPLVPKEGELTAHFGELVVRGYVGKEVPVGTVVPVGGLYPGFENLEENEKAVCYSFSPIYCRDCSIGYVVTEVTNPVSFDGYVKDWLGVVSAYLGDYYWANEKSLK